MHQRSSKNTPICLELESSSTISCTLSEDPQFLPKASVNALASWIKYLLLHSSDTVLLTHLMGNNFLDYFNDQSEAICHKVGLE